MAKMAELHAMLSEMVDLCDWCGDTIETCNDAEECPGPITRRI
jgi:hypothetical protein